VSVGASSVDYAILARDMFGNDARNNGYLAGNPRTGAPFRLPEKTLC